MALPPILAFDRQRPELSDARAAQVAMLTAALAIAHQVAASLRDGLFLATFSVTQLPRIMLTSALVAIVGLLGLLGDAMLSSTMLLAVRRRIPHVLRTERGAAVAQALVRALSADALDVRYRAALALLEVVRDEHALRPESKHVHALVLREVEEGALSAAQFDHVFALLSLSTRGALELARQGLLIDDRKLRGTALEYLESLLHESVRSALVSALAVRPEPRSQAARSETQLLDELKRSVRADIVPPALAAELD